MIGLRSGTEYQIDARGFKKGAEGFVIIEVRRDLTRNVEQREMGGLAYRILDSGASGGIIVTPPGLQEGAALIARAEHIHSVILDPNSTRADFMMKFLNQIMVGVSEKMVMSDSASMRIGKAPSGQSGLRDLDDRLV